MRKRTKNLHGGSTTVSSVVSDQPDSISANEAVKENVIDSALENEEVLDSDSNTESESVGSRSKRDRRKFLSNKRERKEQGRRHNPQQLKKISDTFVPGKEDLVFIPLGGTNEVGMNFSMLGHDGEWLIIDCGVTFYDQLGIDVLTADPTFAVKQNTRIKGLLITHAHEDHIGAVEYLWPILKCPIYMTPFAAAVLRQKIRTKPWAEKVEIIDINALVPHQDEGCETEQPTKKTKKKSKASKAVEESPSNKRQWIRIGKFEVSFLSLTHSIPEPTGYAIRTPLGTVVHTGDWKIDDDPVIGEKINKNELKELGKQKVLAYFSDSTNIFSKEDPTSEKKVREKIIDLVAVQKDRRVTIACFASNVARVETAFLAAQKSGRRVAIIGRSLQRMVVAAQETGYLQNIGKLISDKEAMALPPEKVLLLCTGSQGEDQSALMRIASDQHPVIKMNEHDVILFSSRVIPGNEKSIGELHNLLAQKRVDIVTAAEEDIHASGHPSRDSIKKMYDYLRPHIVVPVHGEARQLIAQEHFAKEQGIPVVITPRNGYVIQLAGPNPSVIGEVPSGRWAVDGKRMILFSGNIIK